MTMQEKKALVSYLAAHITPNKHEKMQAVLEYRTRHVTVVLEDIFQPHNASASLRSCDVFGIQNVQVIEDKNKFEVIPSVAMGAAKWLDINRYTETETCITNLKTKGYRIVATTPHTDAYILPGLPLDQKIALLFGTEQAGLSDAALQHVDMYVKIPMFGFTESLNVSVSVALCLYHIAQTLHRSSIAWQLTPDEKLDIMLVWIRRMLKSAPELEEQFFKGA